MYKKILLGTLIFTFSISAAVAQKQYRLLGTPELGSKYRPVEVQSPIPFDKSYDELTKEQRNLFRQSYSVLKETEKPPYPKAGTGAIYEPIIEGHEKIARGGTLFLVAMVNEKGKVEGVSVYESPTQNHTELATAVLFNTEFDPAVCDGTPCKMEFPFEFKLRNKKRIINN